MAQYKLADGGVIDGSRFIPDEMRNRDWRGYQAWLAAGNVPDPADPPPPPPMDYGDELRSQITSATSLPQLKVALLGTGGGHAARVSGRPR